MEGKKGLIHINTRLSGKELVRADIQAIEYVRPSMEDLTNARTGHE